jgi:very-short-patch-repair endonuclease
VVAIARSAPYPAPAIRPSSGHALPAKSRPAHALAVPLLRRGGREAAGVVRPAGYASLDFRLSKNYRSYMRYSQNYNSIPFNHDTKDRAAKLRKARVLSESLFWNEIKNGKFLGLDFDRQKPIGNYFADFYCAELGLVVEIDGASHNDKAASDGWRDEYMQSLGLRVVRIAENGVRNHIDMELDGLKKIVEEIRRAQSA